MMPLETNYTIMRKMPKIIKIVWTCIPSAYLESTCGKLIKLAANNNISLISLKRKLKIVVYNILTICVNNRFNQYNNQFFFYFYIIHLSICLYFLSIPVYLFTYLPVCLSICLSVYMPIILPVYAFTSSRVYLSTCLPDY